MANYVQEAINSYLDEFKIISWDMQPTKFYSITFHGWDKITFSCDDPTFNDLISIAGETAKNIINKYKETHALSEPQFYWKPNGEFGIEIGLMELELYDEIMKRREMTGISNE